MRILLLGNSHHFNSLLSHRLSAATDSSAATVTVRLEEKLFEARITVGAGEIEASGVWAIEALQADGIIYSLV